MSVILGIFTVALQITAFIILWKQGKKVGAVDSNAEIRRLRAERDLANLRIQEVMKEKHLLEEKHGPLRPAETVDQIMERRRKRVIEHPVRVPPPPPPRFSASNFSGGHTTHHTHHDHLPGVVLGMAVHDALASSGDGCPVAGDSAGSYATPGSSDENFGGGNSCVDSAPAYEAPAYEAPSYSAPSYEAPSCSSSTDYSSGSTDYGCSDTSSSSSSFGD